MSIPNPCHECRHYTPGEHAHSDYFCAVAQRNPTIQHLIALVKANYQRASKHPEDCGAEGRHWEPR